VYQGKFPRVKKTSTKIVSSKQSSGYYAPADLFESTKSAPIHQSALAITMADP